MTKHGVKIFTNTKVEKFEQLADGLNLTLMGDNNVNLTVDTGLCLKYMAPNLSNLTLENAGVEVTQNGAILVDKYSSTTQPNIFAIGDCTNRMKLTPVAIAEARAFVDTEFGKNPQTLNYELIPISVSSIPEAATVGLTEAQAREKFGESVQCYRQEFKPLFYGLTNKDEKTLLKLVVDGKSERVIGAHMVGQYAPEIIQSIALAMKLGATKKDLDTSIGIHPSIAEEIFSL
jgi:glutathione reductase (NADPH)